MKLTLILMTIGIFTFGQTTTNKKIGEKIEGNFLGNGKKVIASVIKTKEAKGNPIEDGTPAEYEIRFSDKKLKPIKAGCCELILINEGDLNRDGIDEISIYQSPMNGCTYAMETYSNINGNWKKIVDRFLIPTGCDGISKDDLQNKIFREKNQIFYLEKDMSEGNGKLIKKKVNLK
ncbi:hypothetical protein [Epilithonimonas xixisoli]|uniref:VCBS repeat-containing protein n=1 Tax=Epilithonimonas xixisoli TaxID=1476462 RepID=A0A4R8I9P1_9FLAO|nr:hypothetical protein [Epilithonimonas xixisoli]TDX86808.1 hypothetical protein B0I22_0960 [Epilithonimonas xixisoli]